MTIQTQNDYQIEGNSAIPKELKDLFPIIGNLTYNKLGKEVLARHNEKFKGKKVYVGHAAFYVGNGKVIDAEEDRGDVREITLKSITAPITATER